MLFSIKFGRGLFGPRGRYRTNNNNIRRWLEWVWICEGEWASAPGEIEGWNFVLKLEGPVVAILGDEVKQVWIQEAEGASVLGERDDEISS